MRLTAVLIGVGGLILLLSGAFFYSASLSTVRADDDHSGFRSRATLLEIGAAPIAGSIEKTGLVDHDYFKFETLRGTKYTLTLDLGTLDDAEFKILHSADRKFGEAESQSASWVGGNKQLEWVAPTTGTYFLGVIGVRAPARGRLLLGDYALSAKADTFYQDQHGETVNEATPLALGSQYSESISPWLDQPMGAKSVKTDYDRDVFSLDAKRGVAYQISTKLDGLDGLAVSVETRSGIVAASHEVVAANNGVDSTVDWIAPNRGTYYVVISGTDLVRGPGFYILEVREDPTLEDRHGSRRSNASPLLIGSGIEGAISPAEDADFFSFEAARGVKYVFNARMATGIAAMISVQNASGATIFSNRGLGSSLSWVAGTPGTHYAVVQASPLERSPVGAYVFEASADRTLEDRHPNGKPGATLVHFGTPHAGSISPADDQDFFYFQAKKGTKYDFRIGPEAAAGVSMSLVGSLNKTEGSISGPGATLEWTAPKSSAYYVVFTAASGGADALGRYSLIVNADVSLIDRHSDQRTGATRLTMGIPQQGSINPAGDRDYFSFSGARGVVYDITVDPGSATDLQIAVTGATDRAEVSNNGQGNRLVWVAPANYNYHVVVSNPGGSGIPVSNYSVLVKAATSYQDMHGETRERAARIDLNTAYPGALSPRDDRDYFQFEARRGVVYHVDTGPEAVVDFSIFNSDGTLATSNENQRSSLSWSAPRDGNYFVAVSAITGENELPRTYTLEITGQEVTEDRHGDSLKEATRVRMGSRMTGAISPAEDLDRFYFRATPGVLYTADLTYGTAATVSLSVAESRTPHLIVASNYGEDSSVKWLSPNNAEYVVTISRAPQLADPVGTYYLTVTADASVIDRHPGELTGASKVEIGSIVPGAISPAADTDAFAFDGKQGANYLVRVHSLAGQPARFSVINPKASYSETNQDAVDTLLVTAPATGKYYVVISGGPETVADVTKYELTVTLDEFSPTIAAIPTLTSETTAVTPEISLAVASRVALPGSSVRAPILLTGASNITGLGFSLLYDPDVFEFAGVESGSLLAPADFNYSAQDPGVVRFGFSSSEPVSGSGSVAVVVFRAVGDADSSSPLKFTLGLAADSDGKVVSMALADGQLSIGARIAGDGNGDGTVSALDALIAMRMATGLNEVDLALDLDGDGTVTVDDAREILAMAGRGREV